MKKEGGSFIFCGDVLILAEVFLFETVMKRTKFVTQSEPLVETDIQSLETPRFQHMVESGISESDPPDIRNRRIFRNDFMRQVYYLARLGARDADIAEFFGVSVFTLDGWKKDRPEFMEMLREGRWVFGMKVADTLGKRALGYDYIETEHSQHLDRFGRVRKLKKKTYKHMPPDVVAIQFILKNRFRDLWADINKTEVETKMQLEITKRLDFSAFSEEERRMLKGIVLQQAATVKGYGIN